jgi:hypothetical protein
VISYGAAERGQDYGAGDAASEVRDKVLEAEAGESMFPGVSVTRSLTGPDRCRAGSPAGSASERSVDAAGRTRNATSKAEWAIDSANQTDALADLRASVEESPGS